MPIVITAASGGFHFRGPTGKLIAPEVYFANAFNPGGEIYQSDGAQTWWTKESFVNDAVQVEAVLARDAALPPGARAGDTTELALTGFIFTRQGENGPETIGQLDLGRILTVAATFAPNGSAAIGGGAKPNWIANVGPAIKSAFAADGFVFSGSDGADVYDPATGVLPVATGGDIRGFGGDDILVGQAGGGRVFGGQGDDEITSRGGVHVFWGGAGDDAILLGNLRLGQIARGGRGADEIEGGRGGDSLFGGRGRDRIEGGEGADELKGGGARDRIGGGTGDDVLSGGNGGDRLKGGFGADTLDGGAGSDKLIGGAGADCFVFSAGTDIVADFDPLSDRIMSGDAPQSDLRVTDTAFGAVISFDGLDGGLLLVGVAAEELTDANFLF